MNGKRCSIPKLVGIETEYGLVRDPASSLSLHTACERLIEAAAQLVRWVPTDRPTSKHDLMLSNGARLYIDLDHPEYATPIARNAAELVVGDRAGEMILTRALTRAREQWPEMGASCLYKSSVDRANHSYGCHENYLVSPNTFECIVNAEDKALRLWVPYLVTRSIFCGAGFIGKDEKSEQMAFYLSPRSLFIRELVGLDTTHERAIINTRDEPYADHNRFRRLHVIVGEANRAEYSTFLKIGVTQLVLEMFEVGELQGDYTLADPITALKTVSRTPSTALPMRNGKTMTAYEIQLQYLTQAQHYLEHRETDSVTEHVLAAWRETLEDMAESLTSHSAKGLPTSVDLSSVPLRTRLRLDWLVKGSFLEKVRAEKGWSWSDPRLAELENGYHELGPKSLFPMCEETGLVVKLPIERRAIKHAMEHSPSETRAAVRSHLISSAFETIDWANWTTIACKDRSHWILLDPTETGKRL